MSKTKSDRIYLLGQSPLKESSATAALKAGNVVELTATGVRKQATAGKNAPLRVAVEEELAGKTKDGEYAVGSQVYYRTLQAGDEAQVRVPASAAAIVRGDSLQFNAAGNLVKATTGTVVAQALEALDNSGGSEEAFLAIEAL